MGCETCDAGDVPSTLRDELFEKFEDFSAIFDFG
jgi:hypothetical protein